MSHTVSLPITLATLLQLRYEDLPVMDENTSSVMLISLSLRLDLMQNFFSQENKKPFSSAQLIRPWFSS